MLETFEGNHIIQVLVGSKEVRWPFHGNEETTKEFLAWELGSLIMLPSLIFY